MGKSRDYGIDRVEKIAIGLVGLRILRKGGGSPGAEEKGGFYDGIGSQRTESEGEKYW